MAEELILSGEPAGRSFWATARLTRSTVRYYEHDPVAGTMGAWFVANGYMYRLVMAGEASTLSVSEARPMLAASA